MDSRCRKQKSKNMALRCAFSGKKINKNDEVILIENLVAYARKLGYIISNFRMLFLFLFLGLFLFPHVSSMTWPNNLTENLVSYYSYDDGNSSFAVDLTGRNNLALDKNDRKPGYENLANYHTASSTERDINLTPVGFGSGATSISVSFWVNRTGSGKGMLGVGEGAENTYFFIDDDIASFGGPTNNLAWSGVTQNVWTHIVVTTDASGNFSVWKDGSLDANKDNGVPNFAFNKIYLGYTPGTALYQDGFVDEVAIFNSSLTYSQIQVLYDGGLGTFYTNASCTPSWTNTSWSDWVNYENCLTDDNQTQNRSLVEYDLNVCVGSSNVTHWEWQNVSCNYCSFSLVNFTLVSWHNVSNCSGGYETENSTITTYDQNNATCYAVTLLPSDAFNNGMNLTEEFSQQTSCTEVNSSWFEFDLDFFSAVIVFILFIAVCLLIYVRMFVFAGWILILLGFSLLFSGFNSILSVLFIFGGVVTFFLK